VLVGAQDDIVYADQFAPLLAGIIHIGMSLQPAAPGHYRGPPAGHAVMP
jgi:hypothetical protein